MLYDIRKIMSMLCTNVISLPLASRPPPRQWLIPEAVLQTEGFTLLFLLYGYLITTYIKFTLVDNSST